FHAVPNGVVLRPDAHGRAGNHRVAGPLLHVNGHIALPQRGRGLAQQERQPGQRQAGWKDGGARAEADAIAAHFVPPSSRRTSSVVSLAGISNFTAATTRASRLTSIV